MARYPIVHVEIPTTDREASGKFYSDLFGWEVAQHPEMDYATFAAEGGPGGGFAKIDGQMVKPGEIKVYMATDNIEETLARANDLGAKTLVPKTEIPGYGFFAFFLDPFGNQIGLFSM
jgi:predicted enzyme related to lactoylglutathione lyase